MPTWNKAKKFRHDRKVEIISHYGGKCSCCGEDRLVFLVIDHIDGGGEKHRKIVGGGSKFYVWLQKKHFPSGFQVLCHNCNYAKQFGLCPHKM